MPEPENKPSAATPSRRFLKFVLATGLLLGAVLVGILLFLDLNSFRKPIMDGLSRATGLSIEIESISLSLAHGLSLRCGGLKVRSSDGSREIFAAQDLFLDAELKPLLNRELKIRRISVVKPTMKIPLGAAGLILAPPSAGERREKTPPETGAEPKPPAADLMEPLRNIFNRQDLSLRIVEILDGELILLRPESDSLPSAEIPVRINARFELSRPDTNRVHILGELSEIKIKNLRFKGTLEVDDLLAELILVNVDLVADPFPVADLKALAETFVGPDAVPSGLKVGQVEKIFIHMEGPLNPNDRPLKDLVAKIGFQMKDIEIEPPANSLTGNIVLPYLDGEGTWSKGTLNYKIKGKLWEGDILSTLVLNLPRILEGSFQEGTFNADIRLQKLNLAVAGFPATGEWTPTAGTVSGSFNAQGKVGGPTPIRTSGKLEIRDLVLGSQKNPGKVAQVTLTVQQKTPQRTLARIQVKNALFNNIVMKKAEANLRIEPGKISLSNGRIIPANGIIQLSGDYRPRSDSYVVRINGKKLRAEDFLKEQ
ncbi:MAG: hypothetical protein IID18_03260, partial [Nitrospinae bacterium]|nr:hypothetical protein [Nitrospinota bacterium]